jgi:sec-independent protein translocase protein TatA
MQELLIILVLVLLLFGAKKVPEMARGLGQGLQEFKRAAHEAATEETGPAAAAAGPDIAATPG